jgi:hypothetical protein
MLTILTNPSVLEHFHTERQRRLRPTPPTGVTASPAPAGIRVRIGRALIGAGTALAGERVEPARHSSNPQPRAA